VCTSDRTRLKGSEGGRLEPQVQDAGLTAQAGVPYKNAAMAAFFLRAIQD
jgi:hypothetical protein